MINILHRQTGAVVYASATADEIEQAVLDAVVHGANLSRADLSRADLSRADLTGADGLLPDGITPLQILGTRHSIIAREPGLITIGCEHRTAEWWRKNCRLVGEREKYTEAEIAEYAAHIEHCAQWMSARGIAEPEPAAGLVP